MVSKVLILTFVVLVGSLAKNISPRDLHDIMHYIHSNIIHSITEKYYSLKEYNAYISQARHERDQSFIKELQPYFDYYNHHIYKIEKGANKSNVDISSCIKTANSHIESINNDLILSLRGLHKLEITAQILIMRAFLHIYTEPKFKLDNMWSEVEQCSNNGYATELLPEIIKQNDNITHVINESYSNVVNFIVVTFKPSLEDYNFDKDAYLFEVYSLLIEVYDCTTQLVTSLTTSDVSNMETMQIAASKQSRMIKNAKL